MNLRIAITLTLLGASCACAAPVGLALSPDGSRLFVAMERPPSILVTNPADGTVTATWNLPETPKALTLSPDGSRLFVPAGIAPGFLLTLNTADGSLVSKTPAGHSPRHAVVSADGTNVFVCNQFENRIDIHSSGGGERLGAFQAIREPVAAALRPDGKALFVTNLLPYGPANSGDIAAEMMVFDTQSGLSSQVRLPNGSMDARALTLSPDGRFVYLLHTLARYALPTTQLDRGWMNTSALSIIDANQPALVTTVLLDDIDLGAANPAAVACSPDGRLLAIAHAGTHELSLIDRAALHERIDRVGRGEPVTEVSKSVRDIPNDLSFLHGIRKRIRLNGNGPRQLVATPTGFLVACYFSETLHRVTTGSGLDATVADSKLGGPLVESQERIGERIFFDATRCFQQWQSCSTCHPGVRTDALNWDLLNDGIGNPKQTKSLLFSIHTPPAMISGIRPNAETAIRTGMRFIQFMVAPEEEAIAIESFLRGLQPIPSPALVDGKLSPAAERGKLVFDAAACSRCHSGPYLTDGRPHDIGNAKGLDAGRTWDTPTLRELWRTAPYLHDGSAATLEEVITTANPDDRHGKTTHLTPEQRQDLVEYLRSL